MSHGTTDNIYMDSQSSQSSRSTFITPSNVTGQIMFFILSSTGDICTRMIEKRRVHPSELNPQHCSFIQCINHIGFDSKAKGTLCGIVRDGIPSIGIIIFMDDTSTSIATVTNPSCFFRPTTEPRSIHNDFNCVTNIMHESVYSGKVQIFILNQLNKVSPFPSRNQSFQNTISMYDGCINCSPHGPDIFEYETILHNDKLTYHSTQRLHKSSSKKDVKKKV